jgi:hypothetical protein
MRTVPAADNADPRMPAMRNSKSFVLQCDPDSSDVADGAIAGV